MGVCCAGYVSDHECTRMHTHHTVYTYAHMHTTRTHLRAMHTHHHVYTCMHVHVCAHIIMYIHVCTHTRTHTHTHTQSFLTEYVATRWYRAPEVLLSWSLIFKFCFEKIHFFKTNFRGHRAPEVLLSWSLVLKFSF